jgi:osmotically-inducible protein OsmY
MDDRTLRQHVIDELDWEPTVDAANIGVAVSNGVVTLTGHVPTYAQLIAAEEAVRRVKGVSAIAQDIEVRFTGAAAHSDEDIAGRAALLIKWNAELPKDAIQVKVTKGWITLTGEVEWQFQRASVEDSVRTLVGVKGVTNLIAVKARPAAEDVVGRIEAALARDARLESHRIKVSMHNGAVRLEGRVRSWYERDAAERAAWSAPGVEAVDDQLVIG